MEDRQTTKKSTTSTEDVEKPRPPFSTSLDQPFLQGGGCHTQAGWGVRPGLAEILGGGLSQSVTVCQVLLYRADPFIRFRALVCSWEGSKSGAEDLAKQKQAVNSTLENP